MYNKIQFLILFLFSFQSVSSAQQFDYSFSQRIENYEHLEQPVPLSSLLAWYSEAWDIPIGFEFNFFDYNFDSVTVYCASSLYFGYTIYEDALHFAGFSQAITDRGWEVDGISLSPISYQLIGNSPNRICKIEFQNAGFDYAPVEDSVHIQIWLFEINDAIEIHLGPHFISGPESYETIGAEGPIIGFLNDLDQKYAFLYSNAQIPDFGFPPASFTGLEGDWPSGQVYTFTPQSSPTREIEKKMTLNLSPNPCTTHLQISSPQSLEGSLARIFDTTGRLMLEETMDNKNSIIISALPFGVYSLNIAIEGIQYTKVFVKH